MDLVKSSGRFTIWFKIGILIFRVKENITGRTIAGPEFIFTVIQFFRKFPVKSKKKIPKSIFPDLFTLSVKSRFGRCIDSTSEKTVQFFPDTVSFHSQKHQHIIFKTKFSVSDKINSGFDSIFFRCFGKIIDSSK